MAMGVIYSRRAHTNQKGKIIAGVAAGVVAATMLAGVGFSIYQNARTNEKVDRLQDKMDANQKDLKKALDDITKGQTSIEGKIDAIQKTIDSLPVSGDTNVAIMFFTYNAINKIDGLSADEKAAYEKQLQDWQQKYEKLEKKYQQLGKDYTNAQKRINELENRPADQLTSQERAELENLRKKSKEWDAIAKENENLKKSLIEKDKRIETLETEKEENEKKLIQLQKDQEANKKEIEKLQKEIKIKDKEIQDRKDAYEKLLTENATLLAEKTQLEAQVAELQKIANKHKGCQTIIDQLTARISELESTITAAASHIDETSSTVVTNPEAEQVANDGEDLGPVEGVKDADGGGRGTQVPGNAGNVGYSDPNEDELDDSITQSGRGHAE